MTTQENLDNLAMRAKELVEEVRQHFYSFEHAANAVKSEADSFRLDLDGSTDKLREALSNFADAAQYLAVNQAAEDMREEGEEIAGEIEEGENN